MQLSAVILSQTVEVLDSLKQSAGLILPRDEMTVASIELFDIRFF